MWRLARNEPDMGTCSARVEYDPSPSAHPGARRDLLRARGVRPGLIFTVLPHLTCSARAEYEAGS